MKLHSTRLRDLMVADAQPLIDHRGAFTRLFCAGILEPVVGGRRIAQINHSRTAEPGTIRGLHFQWAPRAEMKLVRCLRGRVFDVAVDLRAGSPTFLQWHAEELSSENARMMMIPEGFAHGFQVLEPDSELLYLHTEFYAPDAEGGVPWDDAALSIEWPLPAAEISARDRSFLPIPADFQGITL